jgi:hypothetical protein
VRDLVSGECLLVCVVDKAHVVLIG